jgi:hypothetical protein
MHVGCPPLELFQICAGPCPVVVSPAPASPIVSGLLGSDSHWARPARFVGAPSRSEGSARDFLTGLLDGPSLKKPFPLLSPKVGDQTLRMQAPPKISRRCGPLPPVRNQTHPCRVPLSYAQHHSQKQAVPRMLKMHMMAGRESPSFSSDEVRIPI